MIQNVNVKMPTDKAAEAIEFLGSKMAEISTANDYFTTIQEVSYGVVAYDYNKYESAKYPRVHIIANNVGIPNFTTTESQTELPVKVVGYLRKNSDLETGLASYKETLNFSQDLRKAVAKFLKEMPLDIDADLENSSIQQTIGFPGTLLTIEMEFSIIFNECLLQ